MIKREIVQNTVQILFWDDNKTKRERNKLKYDINIVFL